MKKLMSLALLGTFLFGVALTQDAEARPSRRAPSSTARNAMHSSTAKNARNNSNLRNARNNSHRRNAATRARHR